MSGQHSQSVSVLATINERQTSSRCVGTSNDRLTTVMAGLVCDRCRCGDAGMAVCRCTRDTLATGSDPRTTAAYRRRNGPRTRLTDASCMRGDQRRAEQSARRLVMAASTRGRLKCHVLQRVRSKFHSILWSQKVAIAVRPHVSSDLRATVHLHSASKYAESACHGAYDGAAAVLEV